MFYSIEQDLHSQKYREPKKKNLMKKEFKAIRSLNKKKDIIIKPADKKSAIVILNKQSYIDEGQRQLHDTQFYEETDSDLTGEVIQRINLHGHNMLQRGQITLHTCNYLTTDIDRTQKFYLLPKIHKDPLNQQERPTVSGSGGPTEKNISTGRSFYRTIIPTFSVLH